MNLAVSVFCYVLVNKMSNRLNILLALVVLIFLAFGCSSAGNEKISTETKTSYTPAIEVNPEFVSPPVIADAPTKEIKPETESIRIATVISENASLRKIGSQNGEILDVIPEGASVEIVRQKGAWFYVRVDEKAGWLHGDAIRYNDAPTEGYTVPSDDYSTVTDSMPEPIQSLEPVRTAPAYSSPAPVVRNEPTPEIYTLRTYPTPAPSYERETTVTSTTATALCADGTLSYSANRQGTCSHHGGVSSWFDGSDSSQDFRSESTYSPSYSSDSSDRPKTVNVRGYTRKDGTYVAPYKRSAPRRRN